MKIGVDIRPLQEGITSGIGQYTYHILVNLVPLDSDIEYHFFYNACKPHSDLFTYFPFPNITWHTFHISNRVLNACILALHWPKLDTLVGGVDVWFSPSWSYTALSSHVKQVLVVHDISFRVDPSFFTFRRNLWHRLVRPKYSCNRAHHIIAVSHSTKEDLVDLYDIPKEKISVVHEAAFMPMRVPSRIVSSPYMLYVGTIEPRKNISAIVEAFNIIRATLTIDLVIAGKKGWDYDDTMHAINTSPYTTSIHVMHEVDEDTKASLYAYAELFVFPTLYEGFGLPVLEAMSYGIPVITSLNSSLTEVGGSAVIYVDPLNVMDITRACEEVLHNAPLRVKLSHASKEQSKKFSWDKAARETLNVLRACA